MTDETAPQTIAPIAPTEGEPIAPLATAVTELSSVAEVAADLAAGKPVDPAQVVEAVVTTASLFAELVDVVSRDARGISHHLESVLGRSKSHLGL
jgi:hypothetical protein